MGDKMSAGVQFFQVYSDIGAGKHGTIEGVSFLSNQLAKTYPNATTHKIYPQKHHIFWVNGRCA